MAYRNPYYDPAQPHHRPDGFRNLDAAVRIGGDFWRWQRERRAAGVPRPPREGYAAFAQRWTQTPDFQRGGQAQEIDVWWLGHSSVLLRIEGRWVLTDPLLSERASPLRFAGPARRVPAVVDVAGLPPIDLVLISHNHYDHFDAPTLRALVRHSPQAHFLAPLGLRAPLQSLGAQFAVELDWWQSWQDSSSALQLHCVPAQHWSARSLWDRNRTLWCGWVLECPGFRFYFAGDTGDAPQLREIATRYGAPDLAALPIGAYAPRWFMRGQHIDPGEAVGLHRELGARHSLAIHWGTFEPADDGLDEPLALLHQALAEADLGATDFWTLKHGEHRSVPRRPAAAAMAQPDPGRRRTAV